jgi:hypothetical protein
VAFPAFPGASVACSEAYSGASLVYEPCAEMHDRMVESYSNLVEPCYNPCRSRTVAGVG